MHMVDNFIPMINMITNSDITYYNVQLYRHTVGCSQKYISYVNPGSRPGIVIAYDSDSNGDGPWA